MGYPGWGNLDKWIPGVLKGLRDILLKGIDQRLGILCIHLKTTQEVGWDLTSTFVGAATAMGCTGDTVTTSVPLGCRIRCDGCLDIRDCRLMRLLPLQSEGDDVCSSGCHTSMPWAPIKLVETLPICLTSSLHPPLGCVENIAEDIVSRTR